MTATEDPALNPGQQRKLRIIEKTFGPAWRESHPGMAIDAVYNMAIDDDRKPLFCKIEKNRKARLTEMLAHYDATMGDFLGKLIDDYWAQYQEQRRKLVSGIAEDYSTDL